MNVSNFCTLTNMFNQATAFQIQYSIANTPTYTFFNQ